jgi:hypothetical protein
MSNFTDRLVDICCQHAHVSRCHYIENTDLRSDKPRGMSRQSRRREALNLTKRARAAKVHAQPITNFFAVRHALHFIRL